jgi:hypothetical protein
MDVPEHRRRYSPEFREEAARLVIDSGRRIADVARELSIHDGTCYPKKVIGYAMAQHMGAELVCYAPAAVARNRRLAPGAVFHSDRRNDDYDDA